MIFYSRDDKPVEVNTYNFKQIIRGEIKGAGLVQVEFKDGSREWVKATDEEILKAGTEE